MSLVYPHDAGMLEIAHKHKTLVDVERMSRSVFLVDSAKENLQLSYEFNLRLHSLYFSGTLYVFLLM